MKATFTYSAKILVCCFALMSACKKENSDPEPTSVPVPLTTKFGFIRFSNHEYRVYNIFSQSDTSLNYYVINTWSAYQGDTLSLDIVFNTSLPTIGTHSLNAMDQDARMYVETATLNGSSAGGECNVSMKNGHYEFLFNNVDIRDQSGISVKFLGQIYAP